MAEGQTQNVDDIFTTKRISEIKEIHVAAENKIEQKKEELRQTVG